MPLASRLMALALGFLGLGLAAVAEGFGAQERHLSSDVPKFNNSRCPAFWELQAPHVVESFILSDLEGFFYELAFHDVTQFPLCLTPPKCITSSKAIQRHADGSVFVNDTWDIGCFDHMYPQQLLFNATADPGVLLGYVPKTYIPGLPEDVAAKLVFPDTVVDFKAGPEGWIVEMQCVEFHSHVRFVGINYYSKTKSEAAFQEMDAAARARGLGFWMDHGFGLKRVDHSNCTNEPGWQVTGGALEVIV
eukprot:gb/GFBE01007654.1/.p1 GENE.gb/GFBE01007654.1/~~gb/GFBE01007654.1/.p1  ORF type:complete len:248 (+),score=53.45 gb/GFBE01007654.1/:1-744(+)